MRTEWGANPSRFSLDRGGGGEEEIGRYYIDFSIGLER